MKKIINRDKMYADMQVFKQQWYLTRTGMYSLAEPYRYDNL